MKSDVFIEEGGKRGFSIQYMPFTRVLDDDDDDDNDNDDVHVEVFVAMVKRIAKVRNIFRLAMIKCTYVFVIYLFMD